MSLISNIGLPVGKGAGFSTVLSSNSGPDTAFLVVNLVNEGRKTGTDAYVRQLRETLNERFPREQFLFVEGGIINAALNEGVAAPIDIQISAGSLERARKAGQLIVRALRPVPGAVDVQIAQALDYPQLDIRVDRTKAAYYGLTQRDVAENVLTALGSSAGFRPMIWVDPRTGTDFFMGVQFADNEADSLEELRNLPLVVDQDGTRRTVPLAGVAEIRRVNIPGEIARVDISRVTDVYVNVSERDLGSVVRDVEFVDPFLIMLAVPLGLAGVVLMLFVTGTTQNIQSLTGALMLIGVVVNRSILIVEFANARMRKGAAPADAVLLAARTRLRPILMTALVLVASGSSRWKRPYPS